MTTRRAEPKEGERCPACGSDKGGGVLTRPGPVPGMPDSCRHPFHDPVPAEPKEQPPSKPSSEAPDTVWRCPSCGYLTDEGDGTACPRCGVDYGKVDSEGRQLDGWQSYVPEAEVERLMEANDLAAEDLADLSRLLPGNSQAAALCDRALVNLDRADQTKASSP